MRQDLIQIVCLLGLLSACGAGPDGESGIDGRRDEAQTLPFEEWVTDENGVDYAKGDRTDWKKVKIAREGTLFVQIACDNKNSNIGASLHNKYGKLLIEKEKKRGLTDHIRFEGAVSRGNYFIRIYAKKSQDNSVYTIRASMEGTAGIGDIPPPE